MYNVVLGIETTWNGCSVLGQEHQVRARSIAGAAKKAVKAAGRERQTTPVTVRTPSGREVSGTWRPNVPKNLVGRVLVLARSYLFDSGDDSPSRALDAVIRSAIALANGRVVDAARNADEAFQAGGETEYWQGFRDQVLSLAAEVPFEFRADE